MSGIINEFSIFFKKHPVANSIVSFLFGGLLGGVLSSWGYQEFGYMAIVPIIIALTVPYLILLIIICYLLKKRARLEAKPTTEPLRERYKGLIVSISRLYDSYLFNWDIITECDKEILRKFLEDELDLSWVQDAEITKLDDNKTLRIRKDEDSVEITINENREKATLKIRDGRILNLKVKKEGGELKIYTATKDQVMNTIENLVENREDADGSRELYEVRGVGQTFRAIKHHLGRLEVCWLLCTGDVGEGKELVEHFIKEFGHGTVKVESCHLESPNDIESVYKVIDGIYKKELGKYNLGEKEVITDVTGGTTIMSSAMILACISPDRDIEYVEQKTYNLIKIDENIPEVIFKS